MKMDGMRFNAIVYNGTVEFRSRNGKELDLKGNLVQEFLNLSNGVNCVFDGELMVMIDNYQFADRQTGNGLLNRANKGTITQEQAAMVHASLWDVIPYEDFKKGVCNVPYSTRWTTVSDLIGKQEAKGKRIWAVYSKEVASIDDARAEFERLYSEGYEGTILKCKNGIWENKRTKSQVKFKGELETDLKIVGIQEGTGKYAGQLGAILCESGDGVVKVSVGSGFIDNQRQTFGSELIGKIAAIKYNARITNKQGEESLFLPIFVELREDKDIADNSGDIK
jgi:ATP-dependent DNA ligase